MNVLHVINNLTFGGAEKLVIDIIQYLHREKIQADLLVLNDEKAVYHAADLPGSCKLFFSRKGAGNYHPSHFFAIRKHIKNYDIVHVHLFPAQYWVALAQVCSRKKIPMVTTEHNTFNNRMKYPLFRLAERQVFGRYAKIAAISGATQEALEKWLNLKSNRFITIQNGIDLKCIREAKRYDDSSMMADNIQPEDVLLLMIGRFTAQKDHYTLLRALSLLPVTYKLLLVGEGEKKEEYIAYCRQQGLDSRVIFTGFRKDVPRLLKSVTLSILSSNWEGFGLAAVEAMAAGTPVIASNVPGLKEVVEDAGILFEKGNEKELAAKIHTLAADPTTRQQIIKKQYQRAAIYDMANTCRKYIDLYKSLLPTKKA